jgi:RNA polymerase sigma-70 factor (ECF subfamily)
LLRSDGAGELLQPVGQTGLLPRRAVLGGMRMSVGTRTEPVRRSQAEAAAADGVWRDLHARLRGFVRKRIADPEAADDVAQEVLLRLHRNLADLRVEDRLDAFAYRIARNAIIDHYRARARAKEVPAAPDELTTRIDADGDPDHGPNDERGVQELARCLEPLVQRLPEPYREALTLTDLGGLSQVEAASVAGLSVPGMKTRVQRARAQIHELLTDCCDVALDDGRHIAEVQRTGPCACTPE